MGWTEEQLKVINTREKNLLVSAAAGSGKTAVLVERIISMVTDSVHPIDIDSLLIVTFTKAAAAEMKERIGKELTKRYNADRNNRHLQRQRLLLHNAQITTIHSFCLDVIRNYFHLIDLDPSFRIAEEAELRMISGDVLDELLESYYDTGDEAFLEFVECYGGARSDIRAAELVLKLYELAISHTEPEKWLEYILSLYDIDENSNIDDALWMKNVAEFIRQQLEVAESLENEALRVCKMANGPDVYIDNILDDLEIISLLKKANGYKELWERIGNVSFSRLSAKKVKNIATEDIELAEELKDRAKSLRDQAKGYIKDIIENYFYQEPKEMIADIIHSKSAMKVLVQLTLDFMSRFAEKKREKSVMDFADIEQMALRILSLGYPAEELADKYYEIMIDEYQDSNEVQDTILAAVSGERSGRNNRFMVGDVKQSIYKFRLAKPEIFMDKYKSYGADGTNNTMIELRKNFRSREEVLTAINDICSRIMIESVGGIKYDEQVYLYPGAEFDQSTTGNAKGEVELLGIVRESEEAEEQIQSDADSEDASTDMSEIELEANVAVQRIQKLMGAAENTVVWDKQLKSYRPVRYGDIVILLRSTKGRSDVFVSILQQAGIPAYSDTGTGYFDSREIVTVLNYLRMLDNSYQDIAVTAVLLSPMGELSEEDIANIRAKASRSSSLYDAVREYLAGDDRDTAFYKLERFFKVFDEIKSESRYMGIEQLLRDIYRRTGYYYYVAAMSAGERRCANLDMLLSRAASFENTSYHGLFHFIRYVEKLKKYEIDYGESSILNEANAVRIMSIHKSKGLEFPIVIFAGAGKGFNKADVRSNILIHPELGLGPDCIDFRHRTTIPTLIKKSIACSIQQENMGEEMRILYVALTRAKEKLIITGVIRGDYNRKMNKWRTMANMGEETLRFSDILNAGNYFDLMVPALMNSNRENLFHTISVDNIIHAEMDRLVDICYKRDILLEKQADSDISLPVADYINYTYPFEDDVNIKIKLTVSELKKQSQIIDEHETQSVNVVAQEDTEQLPVPEFIKETVTVKGTERGTVYHKVIEKLPFEQTDVSLGADALLKHMVEESILTQSEAGLVDIAKLDTFIRSDIAERMRNANCNRQLFREVPFVIGIPANEVYPENNSTEPLLIQGVIDAYFVEADEIVLLDYKTDYVANMDEALLVNRYASQLAYYEKALYQLTGCKIKQKLIYSFALGKTIEL